jgi:hypothetical protein
MAFSASYKIMALKKLKSGLFSFIPDIQRMSQAGSLRNPAGRA